jgi:hypothetical protein
LSKLISNTGEAIMSTGLQILTIVHVAISLIAIGSGLVVMYGLLAAKPLDGWTAVFLATTIATSATGFLFPFKGFTPGIGVGIISLVVLGVALFARYQRQMAGPWRAIYVICAVVALYFNVFVLIVQSFQKVPALHDLAPHQSEPPFQIAQTVALVLFVAIAIGGLARFRPLPASRPA